MSVLVKTKQVSERLGVNPSTIHRWVKFFAIPCQKNEHGHYLFSDTDINQLRQIQDQLSNGLTMEEVTGYSGKVDYNIKEENVMSGKFDDQIRNEQMTRKLSELERKIDKKADDVVSYQLFQHRNEIDELMKKVIDLEKRLATLQDVNSNTKSNTNSNPFEVNMPLKDKPRHKSSWVLHLFGLLR